VKVGEKVEVTIRGHIVAYATIKEMADGVALLEFPGTRVTMGYRTELESDAPVETGTAHEMLGIDETRSTDGNDPAIEGEGQPDLDRAGTDDPSGDGQLGSFPNTEDERIEDSEDES
jgi:hypothetical protein